MADSRDWPLDYEKIGQQRGLARNIFRTPLTIPVLLALDRLRRMDRAEFAACRAAWLAVSVRSWLRSWHNTVNCPRADSDSTPVGCRRGYRCHRARQ